jgi:hypothetical protein
MTTDILAYKRFPNHRRWYNKLWLSEKLGYYCGPAGIPPEKSDTYIVRPIMNLSGMSLNATKQYIDAGDLSKTPPGHFWCEWFDGCQHSVSYKFQDGFWIPISSYKADRDEENLYRFRKWERSDWATVLPTWFDSLQDVGIINVEFIGDKIIEVHLRDTPDPAYDILIPIWEDEKEKIDILSKMDYSYIENPDNAEGFLKNPRLGFMVK